MGNNPEKQQIYGAVLSLYISRLMRQVYKRSMLKVSLIFDEFPTIYFDNMDTFINASSKIRFFMVKQLMVFGLRKPIR